MQGATWYYSLCLTVFDCVWPRLALSAQPHSLNPEAPRPSLPAAASSPPHSMQGATWYYASPTMHMGILEALDYMDETPSHKIRLIANAAGARHETLR